jgi:hypothetical protein
MHLEIAAATEFIARFMRSIPDRKVSRFLDLLEIELEVRCKEHWYISDPDRVEGHRCVKIEETLDPVLTLCGTKSGIPEDELPCCFPLELYIWIDPVKVNYRLCQLSPLRHIFRNGIVAIEHVPPSRATVDHAESHRAASEDPAYVLFKFSFQARNISPAKLHGRS